MTLPTTPIDLDGAESAIEELLHTLGFDLGSCPGLLDTPARVARSWAERLGGYLEDDSCLGRTFQEDTGDAGIVLLRDISFHSTCEHHLLPFSGMAHVGYVPTNGRVVGLSKLARIVDVFSRRLQLQERLGREIAEALFARLNPVGVGVIIEAQHGCMVCRGVRKPEARMVTSVMRGCFRELPEARAEFVRLALGAR